MRRARRLAALAAVVAAVGVGTGIATRQLDLSLGTDGGAAAVTASPVPSLAPAEPAPTDRRSAEAAAPTADDGPAGSPSPSPGDPATAGPLPQPSLPPSASSETARRLDAALGRMRDRQGIPGISVTMIFADGSTWTGTSGFADLGAMTPVAADTVFAAASISKTFTAAAILELVEEGRLRLDESVAPHVSSLGLDRRITVRMLLDHTSGLHDYFFNPRIDRALLADRDLAWTTSRSLRYVGKAYFPPGRGWHYSNTNYLLLGQLIEEVTGRSLAKELRDRFLDPLGLDATYFQAVERPRGPVAHGYRYATGVRSAPPIDLSDGTSVMPFRSVVTAAAGAGSLAAPSADIARWARALYGGQVLGPESLASMVDAGRTSRYKPRIPYGLGAQVATIDGRRAFGHSGRFLGARSVMRWLPEQRIAIVVMTNQSRRDPGLVARQLLRVVLGAPPAPAPCVTCPTAP